VPVYSPAFAGTHCAYPRSDGRAELTRVAGYIPRWFTCPQTVTHPGTNRVRRRVTSLTGTNALPLSQTATVNCTLKNYVLFLVVSYVYVIITVMIQAWLVRKRRNSTLSCRNENYKIAVKESFSLTLLANFFRRSLYIYQSLP